MGRLGDNNNDDVEEAIIEHIEARTQQQAQAVQQQAAGGAQPDHLLAVCLYFLGHHLKERDLDFMARLHKLVPVIPLIASATCLTPSEREEYQSRIRARMQDGDAR